MSYFKFAHTLGLIKEKKNNAGEKKLYLRTEVQCEGGVSELSNERSTTSEKNTPTSACMDNIT